MKDSEIEKIIFSSRRCAPTDTSRFDNFCKKLWEDHGIIAFHFQDKRVSDLERSAGVNVAERNYGKRAIR